MKALLQLAGIVAVAAVAGTAYNFANSTNPQKYLEWGKAPPEAAPAPGPKPETSGTGLISPSQPATPSAETPAKPTDEFPRVGTEETLAALQDGTLIIDARRTKDYELGHIPGAYSISPWEADMADKIARLVAEGAVLDAPVVLYCNNSNECEDSKLVARQLKTAGFADLKIYSGGFPAWKEEHPERIAVGSERGELAP